MYALYTHILYVHIYTLYTCVYYIYTYTLYTHTHIYNFVGFCCWLVGWRQSHAVAQASLILQSSCLCSQGLEILACTTMPSQRLYFNGDIRGYKEKRSPMGKAEYRGCIGSCPLR